VVNPGATMGMLWFCFSLPHAFLCGGYVSRLGVWSLLSLRAGNRRALGSGQLSAAVQVVERCPGYSSRGL